MGPYRSGTVLYSVPHKEQGSGVGLFLRRHYPYIPLWLSHGHRRNKVAATVAARHIICTISFRRIISFQVRSSFDLWQRPCACVASTVVSIRGFGIPQALRKAEAAAAAAEAFRLQSDDSRHRAEAAFEKHLTRLRVRAEPLGADRHDRRYWWFPCACLKPCAARKPYFSPASVCFVASLACCRP